MLTSFKSLHRLGILLVGVALAGTARGEDYPVFKWPSEYQAIPIPGGAEPQQVIFNQPHNGRRLDLDLPFPFTFYGNTHNKFHIGTQGIVSFPLHMPHTTNYGPVSPIPSSNVPHNFLAPWWTSYQYCEQEKYAAVQTQVLGKAPNRRFVIQFHCTKNVGGSAGGNPGNTGTEVQIWLAEGSNAIQFKYGSGRVGSHGDYQAGTLAMGVTMGIEGPDGDVGVPVPDKTGGNCGNKCLIREHFPSNSTVQFGLGAHPDLMGEVAATVSGSGSSVVLHATTTLINLSTQVRNAADFDFYLAPRPVLDQDAELLERETFQGAIPGGGSTDIQTQLTIPTPPNGTYYLCVQLNPDGSPGEFDTDNDFFCSDPLHLGPAISAQITSAPATATPGETVLIGIRLENYGTRDVVNVPYEIYLGPRQERTPQDTSIFRTTVSLARGATHTRNVQVRVPYRLPGLEHYALVEVDPHREAPLADRSRSVGASEKSIKMRLPDLELDQFEVEMPNGCYTGQPVIATFRICNEGDVPAIGFTPMTYFTEHWNANLFDDALVASNPVLCLDGNCAGDAVCAEGSCRRICTSSAQCSDGLTCEVDPFLSEPSEVRTCQQRIDPSACRNFELRGTIPTHDANGEPYGEGEHRFFALADGLELLNQGQITSPVYSEGHFCKPSAPELTVTSLHGPERFTTGGTFQVVSTVENQGLIGAPVHRSYLLSPLPSFSQRSIVLELETEDTLPLAPKGSRMITDRVRLPHQIASGTYFFGLVVHPEPGLPSNLRPGQVLFLEQPVEVEGSALRIETLSLHAATIGSPYLRQLTASGGAGAYTWSAEGLPPGLQLSADGKLSGIPTELGIYTPWFSVASGGGVAHRALALEVVPAMGPIAVSTTTLPAAVLGVPYEARLAASGGNPPYSPPEAAGWRIAEGRLPSGLQLEPSGRITGTPASIARSETFVAAVRDSSGNEAMRSLHLAVAITDDLRIVDEWLPEGSVGQPYEVCLRAGGGREDQEYRWRFDGASLPPGLSGDEQTGCVSGAPAACGSFLLQVTVEDSAGVAAAGRLPLAIECEALRLAATSLPAWKRGETVEVQLETANGKEARMRVASGRLPAGLELDVSGLLHGEVSDDAEAGSYPIAVELRDDEGRRGLEALLLVVLEDERAPASKRDDSGGCAAAGGGGGFLAALLALGMLLGLRGRRASLLLSVVCLGLLFGCSDDDDGAKESDLCAQVTCDAPNLSCDPADGECKCGGVLLCGEGERCVFDTTPSCVSTLCEDVDCENGMACDPLDGQCKCNGEICDEGETCWNGSCLFAQGCSGVVCPSGMACDPLDSQCKCGGVVCDEAERCGDEGCVPDPCFGMNCPAGSTCNPADGLCHCGDESGPVCTGGESCVEVAGTDELTFVCSAVDRCAEANCEGGTVCDPRTGACKCGGVAPSDPVCGAGQTCVDGVCLGGDQCKEEDGSPRVCPGGLSCDPLDGLCKCGGMGGLTCDEDQICISDPETRELRCGQSCDLLAETRECPGGEACYFDVLQPTDDPFCAPSGYVAPGGQCTHATQCEPGSHCASSQSGSFCREYCKVSAPGRCQFCAPLRGAPADVGVCMD